MEFLSRFYDENVRFRSNNEINKAICRFNRNQPDLDQDHSKVRLLNIFKTSKQRTYLAVKGNFVYCVLDDARESKPKVMWVAPKKTLINNGKLVKLNLRDKTENTGIIDLGKQHKDWLYSKKLFKNSSIEKELKKTIG
ncbi:hypothetical protein EDB69_0694 [Vibrio crassostreae]|uniref:hypothetical protein n=1 Tax=Vibrio crassostreae TaxID=246167 RepID=UPI000F474DE8|nr:hypothetical protein [Vibrio crassostreae]ROO76018.1 hypothetical protein EDB64_1002 [Vibrio crassostreae]ROP14024.1 hypothetical protein EDB63_1028 [Vibrio crassostreae]ROQ88113.1 hypothetical protein EDB72_1669 [Vibrio crassostreae]RPE94738.1 hypothetical protein EDB68_0771 [Vibrio crassostreae]RPF06204.1 hypothetical protein EDB17_0665 [Vibrio crassostreae]